MTRCYVDWSKIPEEYKWVAVDSPKETKEKTSFFFNIPNCQGVGMFTEKPYIVENSFFNSDGIDNLVPSEAIIGPLPLWRDSLIQRPEASNAQ